VLSDKRNIANGWEELAEKQKKLAAIDQFLTPSGNQSVNTTTRAESTRMALLS
jgi:hypothetical protein